MGIIRDRMAVDLRLAGYSDCTSKNYLMHAHRFFAHYQRPAAKLGAELIHEFLFRGEPRILALYTFWETRWVVARNPTTILRCQKHRGLPPVVLDAAEINKVVNRRLRGNNTNAAFRI